MSEYRRDSCAAALLARAHQQAQRARFKPAPPAYGTPAHHLRTRPDEVEAHHHVQRNQGSA